MTPVAESCTVTVTVLLGADELTETIVVDADDACGSDASCPFSGTRPVSPLFSSACCRMSEAPATLLACKYNYLCHCAGSLSLFLSTVNMMF